MSSRRSEPFQIINEKSEFTNGMEEFFKLNSLKQWGGLYRTISIIGGQSSGKSTLLNYLFGTQFEIMNPRRKRSQVTQGIWIARDAQEKLLIYDVEGSDSTSRWENHKYENLVTLFSLTMANVLIVNIWTTEVGRFNSSQYQVLKTALELNVQLWKVESTKQIYFVLRDFAQNENLEFIRRQIMKDLQRIWEEINKPLGLQMNDIIDVKIYVLPSIQDPQFGKQIQLLRLNILQMGIPSHQVQIEDLQLFATSAWRTISLHEDLNIPEIRKMVVIIRCDSISKELIATLIRNMNELTKSYGQFSKEISQIIESLKHQFLQQTKNYDQIIVDERFREFKNYINLQLHSYVTEFMDRVKIKLQEYFNQQMIKLARDAKETIIIIKQNIIKEYQANIMLFQFCLTQEQIKKNVEAYQSSLQLYIKCYQHHLIELFLKDISSQYNQKMNKVVEVYLFKLKNKDQFKLFNVDLLQKIEQESLKIQNNIIKEFLQIRTSFQLTSYPENYIEQQDWFNYSIASIMPQLQTFAMNKFIKLFKYVNDAPRVWRQYSDDQIKDLFDQSLMEVSVVLRLFVEVRVEEIIENIKIQADREFLDALRYKNLDDQHGLSIIYWVLLLYFMHDNIISWCQNSIFLIIFLLCIVISAVNYYLRIQNGFTQLGLPNPLTKIFQTITSLINKILFKLVLNSKNRI